MAGFCSDCLGKGKKCWESVRRSIWARLPVPTELICSCTEPLAQFSRNRSPVRSHAGALNRWQWCRDNQRFKEMYQDQKKRLSFGLLVGLFNPNQKLGNVPDHFYLSVPGCWLQTEMTGIWHPAAYGCPAVPSSSAAAEGTLHGPSAEHRAL